MNDDTSKKSEADTMSIEQLAARLGISKAKAYEMAQLDEYPFPVIRIGGRVMVSREAYQDWLDQYRFVPGKQSGQNDQEA